MMNSTLGLSPPLPFRNGLLEITSVGTVCATAAGMNQPPCKVIATASGMPINFLNRLERMVMMRLLFTYV